MDLSALCDIYCTLLLVEKNVEILVELFFCVNAPSMCLEGSSGIDIVYRFVMEDIILFSIITVDISSVEFDSGRIHICLRHRISNMFLIFSYRRSL